jgi:hypothetical protein
VSVCCACNPSETVPKVIGDPPADAGCNGLSGCVALEVMRSRRTNLKNCGQGLGEGLKQCTQHVPNCHPEPLGLKGLTAMNALSELVVYMSSYISKIHIAWLH